MVVFTAYTVNSVCAAYASVKQFTVVKYLVCERPLGNIMDTLSNLLTSIRNAEMAHHSSLAVPFSKVSLGVLEVLKRNKYITSYSTEGEGAHQKIAIELSNPVTVHHYKRISKPGRRLYTPVAEIPTVIRGLGMVILSTPNGIMSGKEAKKQNVGGELICEVY